MFVRVWRISGLDDGLHVDIEDVSAPGPVEVVRHIVQGYHGGFLLRTEGISKAVCRILQYKYWLRNLSWFNYKKIDDRNAFASKNKSDSSVHYSPW